MFWETPLPASSICTLSRSSWCTFSASRSFVYLRYDSCAASLLTGIPEELLESGSRYPAWVRSGFYSGFATNWRQAGQENNEKGDFDGGIGREGGDEACSVIDVSFFFFFRFFGATDEF